MLKHILAGQPSSGAGSRLQHHHNDFAPSSSNAAQHQQQHYSSGHPPPQQHRGPRAQSSADVYDGPNAGPGGGGGMLGQRAGPQYSSTRHALNHSQLSVNNLAHRLNASQHSHHALNLSALSASKHSVNSSSPIVGAHLANYATRQQQHPTSRLAQQHPQSLAQQHQQHVQQQHHQVALQQRQEQNLDRSKLNGGLDISRLSRVQQQTQSSPSPVPQLGSSGPATTTTGTGTATATTTSTGPSVAPLNVSWSSSSICRTSGADKSGGSGGGLEPGLKEVLSSLGLLCLVSLLLALLSLTFLVRMSSVSFVPNSLISPEEFAIVYDVTLVLCVLALSLNLCCLLVCAIQFLFAVKLVKAPYHGQR
ncbi:hypothetical protein QAD02_004758 [Eretmocerus hayati]|uniref:Uncharacterized protein n=1 Tax=Eretmocerus hayati TaxID=131215 RepID=A0ACC2NSD1_9HYME|nr:hypothetical protein QAD02_004758 [Eretmocerus hayati]